jgi:hypothetical protein
MIRHSGSMVDPFELFCAYHLGLDERGRFKFANAHDVARRFRIGVEDVESELERNGMSSAHMLELDFDLASAQLDIQVSPPGVDLISIARMHYDLFLSAPEKKRDWQAELDEDERENKKTFGK